jgi:phosphoglycerol transferase MdoB-like AlkP superfamily enzyme
MSSSSSSTGRSFPWATVIGWTGLVLAVVGLGMFVLAVLAVVDYQVDRTPQWMHNDEAPGFELFVRLFVCLAIGLPSAVVGLVVGVAQWATRRAPLWRPRATTFLGALPIVAGVIALAVVGHQFPGAP